MSIKRRAYPPEYREKIVELHRAGRSYSELASEFEPCLETIRSWCQQAETDAGEREGLKSDERAELLALRKKVKRLEMEREILAKATAWFARETQVVPDGHSK